MEHRRKGMVQLMNHDPRENACFPGCLRLLSQGAHAARTGLCTKVSTYGICTALNVSPVQTHLGHAREENVKGGKEIGVEEQGRAQSKQGGGFRGRKDKYNGQV
eukprot:1133221-Pelagomonas_calceolata.AAC.7